MVYLTKHFNMTEFDPMLSEADMGTAPFKNAGLLKFHKSTVFKSL